MAVTMTSRSLSYLRKNGYIAGVVEQNVRYPSRELQGKTVTFKRDLFGFADILAVRQEDRCVTFVQTTTSSHQADRIQKIAGIPHVCTLIRAGCKIHVHGWAKKGPRGGAKNWHVTITEVELDEDGFLKTAVLDSATVGPQADIDFEKPEDDF